MVIKLIKTGPLIHIRILHGFFLKNNEKKLGFSVCRKISERFN